MDDPGTFPEADYAVAWWAGPTVSADATGDYDGNGTVGPEDYTAWRSSFGSTTDLDADGNDDDIINAADFVIWRDNLGAGSGTGSLAAVPEPSSLLLLALAAIFFRRRGRQSQTAVWQRLHSESRQKPRFPPNRATCLAHFSHARHRMAVFFGIVAVRRPATQSVHLNTR